MDTVRIETLGCRLNQIESEAAASVFLDCGFSVCMDGITASSPENPQLRIAIINTCTVTQKAEQKARRIIRLMLKKAPSAVVIVTGCYAQLSAKEIKAIDERVCVIGGQIKDKLSIVPQLLSDELKNNSWNPLLFVKKLEQKLEAVPQRHKNLADDAFKLYTSNLVAHSRASIKIQDGCNNNCSFCAIHIARGRSVSLDPETIVERIQQLEAKGYDEVVITAVNIAQYRGFYEDKECRISELLALILKQTNGINIRISSLYPEVVDEAFCGVIKNNRIRPHFHISVQSGSDKILSAMNRKYDSKTVIETCRMLQRTRNKPFIACDIITGFPGETDEDFKKTLDLCKACDFVWVHAFPYSERPGTQACLMKNKIPQSVSRKRAEELTLWAIENKIQYLQAFVGKKMNAILETVKKPSGIINADKFIYHAVTENFIHCEIVSNAMLEPNKTVTVIIQKVLKERIKKGGDIEVLAQII